MASKSDFTKSPAQVMVDLINAANPTLNLTVADVDFAEANQAQGSVRDTSTSVTIYASASDNRFVGQTDVFYDRISLDEVLAQDIAPFLRDLNVNNVLDLIPQMNARYGIQLGRSDLVSTDLPLIYGIATIPVLAGYTSLLFEGSGTIRVQTYMPLNLAVTITQLSELLWSAGQPTTVTASQRICDQLNAQEFLAAYPFTPNSVSFGLPQAVAGAGFNTQVTMSAVPGEGYTGSIVLSYSRIDLSEILNPATVGLYIQGPFNMDLLAETINDEVGTFLQASDLEAVVLPANMQPYQSYTISVTASPDSLGWKGTGSFQLALNMTLLEPDFDYEINVDLPKVFSTPLPPLTLPPAPPPPAPTPAPAPSAPGLTDCLLLDTFTGSNGTSILSHVPDINPTGWQWQNWSGSSAGLSGGDIVTTPIGGGSGTGRIVLSASPTETPISGLTLPYSITVVGTGGFDAKFGFAAATIVPIDIVLRGGDAVVEVTANADTTHTPAFGWSTTGVDMSVEHTLQVLFEDTQITIWLDGVLHGPTAFAGPVPTNISDVTLTLDDSPNTSKISLISVCNYTPGAAPAPAADYPLFASSFAGTAGLKVYDSAVATGPAWLSTAYLPNNLAASYDTRLYWRALQADYWTLTAQGASEMAYDNGYPLGLPLMLPPASVGNYVSMDFTIESLLNADAVDSWYLEMFAKPQLLDSDGTVNAASSSLPRMQFYLEFYPDAVNGLHFHSQLYSSLATAAETIVPTIVPVAGHQYRLRAEFQTAQIVWTLQDLTASTSVTLATQSMPGLGFTQLSDYANSRWYTSFSEGSYSSGSGGASQDPSISIVQYQHVEMGARQSGFSIAAPAPDAQLAQHSVFYMAIRGNYDQSVFATTDGNHWNRYQGPSFFVTKLLPNGSGGLLAGVEGLDVATSPSGYGSWTQHPMAFNTAATISDDEYLLSDWVVGPDKIVALAYKQGGTNSGLVHACYSVDGGATWTAVNLGITDANCLAYGAGKYVVLTATVTGKTSTDGITWTNLTILQASGTALSPNAKWVNVIFAGGQFVALGNNQNVGNTGANQIMTSPDGTTWTVRSVPAAFSHGTFFEKVCYDSVNAAYVIVGEGNDVNSATIPVILRSADGHTWSDATPTALLTSLSEFPNTVAAGNGIVVAGGTNYLFYSTDGGVTWSQSSFVMPTGASNIEDIVYAA